MKKALLVIDYQNSLADPSGTTYVKDGEKLSDAIQNRIQVFLRDGHSVIFTRDWHPEDHCSFKGNGGELNEHCVKRSWGAQYYFAPPEHENVYHLVKAFTKDIDSFSAFSGIVVKYNQMADSIGNFRSSFDARIIPQHSKISKLLAKTDKSIQISDVQISQENSKLILDYISDS